MKDRAIAGLVTFGAILPLCAVCVLGPAAAGAVLASIARWAGGLGIWPIVAAAVAGAWLARRLWRRHGRARGGSDTTGGLCHVNVVARGALAGYRGT